MDASKEILTTANKVKNETISRYISGILVAGTLASFAFFKIYKMETLAYVSLSVTALLILILAFKITRSGIYKMIEKRATELFDEKIKPVDDLIWKHQNIQYDINNTHGNLLRETGFRISREISEMKNRIHSELAELHLPMNIAIALLLHDLSVKAYNDNNMKSRTHLDDFNENFKTVLGKMNIPGKDNQYKEKLMTDYFKTVNNILAN